MLARTSPKKLEQAPPHRSITPKPLHEGDSKLVSLRPTPQARSILTATCFAFLLAAAMVGQAPSALGQTLMWETPGASVAGIDDLNGDGVPDLIVAAPPGVVVLSGGSGSVIRTVLTIESGGSFGGSIACAGDVDNDGTSDIIIGEYSQVQVFSGSTGIALHTFISPDRFNGEPQWRGTSVAGVGDLDLDGHDDVLVGAFGAEPDGMFEAGQAIVFSGLTGEALFVFSGTAAFERFGWRVAAAGDVNGDAVQDILVGVRAAAGDPKQAFVFSGSDGTVIHTFTGLGEYVAGAGDVNLDGFDDVLLGHPNYSLSTGEAWVLSGQDGSVLHRFPGPAPAGAFGVSVAGAGDVDGDGVPDLLIGGMTSPLTPSVVMAYSGNSYTPLFDFAGPDHGGSPPAATGDLDGDGRDDVAIVRSGMVQVYSSPPPLPPADPDLSTITGSPTEVGFLGESTITVTPKDSGGLILGAGQRVTVQTTSGAMLGAVVDQGDGTYTQIFQAGADSTPAVVSATANWLALTNTVGVTSSSPQSIALANGDLPIAGSLVGSFLDTQALGGGHEIITQVESGGKPAKRYSYLEHKWTIAVPDGGDPLFFLSASTVSTGPDAFDFDFSLDDISYSHMLTVTDNNVLSSYSSFALPPGTSGVVYIRVTDTDQTPGNRVLDNIQIDHMGIASIGGATEVPADPSDLLATAFSSSRIDLTWTDNATDEAGFDIEWSLDASTWNVIDSVAANVTSYSDMGLVAQTEYFYRVVAFNIAGSSGPSNVASATTLPPGGDVDDVASGEVAVQGTVNGSFVDTQANDGVRESIRERESGGKPAKRHSFLEHKWTVDVSGGSSVTFFVKAFHDVSPDGDDFVFAYSTEDSSYVDMLTVTKVADDGLYQSFVLPASTTGTVYIRVRDTDQTQGARDLDSVHVDHLYIRSEN